MSVKRFLDEIKREIECYHILREKIIYPVGPARHTKKSKNDNQ